MAEPNNEPKNELKAESKTELPKVESPSIAPGNEPGADPIKIEAAKAEPIEVKADKPTADVPPPPSYRFLTAIAAISPRTQRTAALAATVMLAAGFGATVGAVTGGALATPPKVEIAANNDSAAFEKTIARLGKELATLKTSVETAAKENRTQIAKITDKIAAERASDVTGSIAKPAVTAPEAVTPIPPPRPVIVQGWSAHEARDGSVLVSNRGEYFQVSQGVPLPGLGPVEAIRRESGRLIVVTPKGVITSAQPTAANRPRVYYPPFYRPY